MTNIIQTENLTKYYGRVCGVKNLTLSVQEGDFFGFIGPNGAGKSTTIRTLLGLIAPTSGKAEIFGKDIAEHRTGILADIGYLPSETAYYSGMRVKDLLALSARMRGIDCEAEARTLCERLMLDPSRKIRELSFGNRKKVGIVCALQHRPRLCVLDEPTSGLDPLMQREFYEILRERNREGMTVFLSSHVLSEIARYCRRAAVIRAGELLVSDSVEKLGHTGVKRVTLRALSGEMDLPGAKDITKENDTVHFLYSGRADALMRALSAMTFEDVTVTDPDLEEIFLHYYTKEDT